MGRRKLVHTKRLYLIRYLHGRYRATHARIDELPERGTARQIAFILGVNPAVVYRWITVLALSAERHGRGPYLILRDDLVGFLRGQGFLRERLVRGEYD